MKFTKMRLISTDNVDFPIVGAIPSDMFLLKGVDGLGPTQQNPTIVNGVVQGINPTDRQIVMRVGLNPNYGLNQTAEQLRSTLYTMMAPKYGTQPVVQFMDDNLVVAEIEGLTSGIEIAPFSKDPEVQITFDCVGDNLVAPNDLTIIPTTKAQFDIPNPGTASVGFEFEITFTAKASKFTLEKIGGVLQLMTLTYPFVVGDVLTINTREFQRSITVDSGGDTITLIGMLSDDSIWLELDPGVNEFDPSLSTFDWGSVTFKPEFLGV